MGLHSKAQKKALEKLKESKTDAEFHESKPDYVKNPEDNLIEGVNLCDIREYYETGKGSELVASGNRPPKFCAAHSSSALAANCFGPFVAHDSLKELSLLDCSSFRRAELEAKCPTGLRGTPPHLDFLAETEDTVIGVESKFLEHTLRKRPKFADSYEILVQNIDDCPLTNAYRWLKQESESLNLDAAQLVKHSLGLLKKAEEACKNAVLLYLFWEPHNDSDFDEVQRHAEELELFKEKVAGSKVVFESRSYRELWDDWESQAKTDRTRLHVNRLRSRYAFSV